ncbi:MAG: homoserine O-acetyltransferase [Lewinella sp.]|nr:homoserine O-acetyltransferase [Lewinella sp.]
MRYLHIQHAFELESGTILPELTIGYTIHGAWPAGDHPVVWVCHALTGNADPTDWWSGLVGTGDLIDPDRHTIICANMLGSCYGTTGPSALRPGTAKSYGLDFPLVTTRDMARAHQLLRQYLGIERIELLIGGSMGGQQALEWAILEPTRFGKLCVLASNAVHSAWGIAFNEAQRMAMLADPSLADGTLSESGRKGLEAARAVAMLSYRHYRTYDHTQGEPEADKIDDFRASSYQRYQGYKLWQRFDPRSYLSLSKSMDSHNVGRGRGGIAQALQMIQAETLVIGIETDVLFPVEEQAELSRLIPRAQLEIVASEYGHDGFLTETATITHLLRHFLEHGIPAGTPRQRHLPPRSLPNRPALPGTESF